MDSSLQLYNSASCLNEGTLFRAAMFYNWVCSRSDSVLHFHCLKNEDWSSFFNFVSGLHKEFN